MEVKDMSLEQFHAHAIDTLARVLWIKDSTNGAFIDLDNSDWKKKYVHEARHELGFINDIEYWNGLEAPDEQG